MAIAMTDDDLIRAYLGTTYRVSPRGDDRAVIEVRIGRPQPALDELVANVPANPEVCRGAWAILTAYNPGQERPSQSENEAAQRRLKAAIDSLGLPAWPACGVEDAPPPGKAPFTEPMFCVGNLSREQAIALGRRFRQLGIVFCEPGAEADLILLRPVVLSFTHAHVVVG